ncbi:FkbM family methyltransferase [Helicobacter aurati]|uniref:FkbM family methyltransferase n=2 Tax=Helicobacter aurati TaxID=137778 RepID=A0A3D8J8J7_9HELI|nr:FkbM family methyltransferase [Helicobacter aurati]RDU73436.1 FkbM family methyltransferase [Helicobacter aurati]
MKNIHTTSENTDNNLPICIDCGTHAGLITDIILFCGGISYAFEPNIYLYNILKSKYNDNPHVILNQAAVSNRYYTTEFLMDCGGILSQGNRIVESVDSTQKTFCVQVVDLSEIIEQQILPKYQRIYFLKLDVEGAEFEIIESLLQKQLYKHIDFIACETHERFFMDSDSKIKKLRDSIKQCGANNIFLDWI